MTEAETKKEIPEITDEEDAPFPADTIDSPSETADANLGKVSDDFGRQITSFKYLTGRMVLYISMIAMVLFAVADTFVSIKFQTNSDSLSNAFEVFKLIAMTVLGYIFGSTNSHSE